MLNRVKLFLCIGASILVAACVTGYKQASLNDDHATIEFSQGYIGALSLSGSAHQQYLAVDGPECKSPRRLAVFAPFRFVANVTKRVPADENIYLAAINNRETAFSQLVCSQVFSFTPKSGASYRITQVMSDNDYVCEIEIMDVATKQVPEDFSVHPSDKCQAPVEFFKY